MRLLAPPALLALLAPPAPPVLLALRLPAASNPHLIYEETVCSLYPDPGTFSGRMRLQGKTNARTRIGLESRFGGSAANRPDRRASARCAGGEGFGSIGRSGGKSP